MNMRFSPIAIAVLFVLVALLLTDFGKSVIGASIDHTGRPHALKAAQEGKALK